MEIPHQRLIYFQLTLETGSIRAASARLNIAPSAVSRQISLLETALDATLIERRRDGVSPTPEGELLLDYCQRRTRLDRHFSDALDAYQRLETGQITLYVGEGFVGDLIDHPLREFTEAHRGVRLNIDTGSTRNIIEAVVNDEAHIGLMYHEQVHPHLRFWQSTRQPLVALIAPDHPLASTDDDPITLAMLADYPLALWHPGHGVRELVDLAFREANHSPLVGIQTGSLEVLKHSARAQLCVTLLPRFAAARELEEGTLVARNVVGRHFTQANAHMVTRVGRRMPRAGLQLLRHLQRWMSAFRSDGPARD
ncbi:LysR family transcriptional regulator [Halomonas sp. ND22Bw]|uniref:LysR family transcriptional regulator n=1 Tax=Halomonas salina TaxID=42565 RepID=A0ABR4WRQ9_9GAMM|nr:LysR family transcriptional regulator [Halomonas salina]KGE77254.1 LysR family transcriptional regulator [Halomonas salina]PSJ23270.1 LysR family transcriptional regulator [Halomonas sp. ND22Bw]